MTFNKKDTITLPKWLIIILIPILMSSITAYGVVKAKDAKLEKQVEINTSALEKKADAVDIGSLKEAMDRIENDLIIIKTSLIND